MWQEEFKNNKRLITSSSLFEAVRAAGFIKSQEHLDIHRGVDNRFTRISTSGGVFNARTDEAEENCYAYRRRSGQQTASLRKRRRPGEQGIRT